jgi:hypothetical protein
MRLQFKNYLWRFLLTLPALLLLLLCGMPAGAKVATDFNPNLDFAKYKTFTYIGGIEQLQRLQVNPDQLKNQIHRAIVRELTSKGRQSRSL